MFKKSMLKFALIKVAALHKKWWKYGSRECVLLTVSYHLYCLRLSKDWSILHHGSVGRVQNMTKEY